MVFLNRLKPSLSICPLMSTTSTVVSLSVYFSRAWSSIRSAMSPVPPATSMQRCGPFLPGRKVETNVSFQRRWTPRELASFMRSYDDATESNTFLTSDSFSSSGTVLNPNDAVRGVDLEESDAWVLMHLANLLTRGKVRRTERCIQLRQSLESCQLIFDRTSGCARLPLIFRPCRVLQKSKERAKNGQ